MFTKYFCSAFGKKQDDVLISHEDEDILSSPLVTEEDGRRHLLGINICRSAGPDNLPPRVLKELGEEISVPLFLIINKS